MPLGGTSRGRRRFRRRSFRKRPLKYRVARVQRQVSTIRKAMEAESNNFDTVNANVTLPDTGTFVDLTANIPQGDGTGERIGNSISLRSIFFRLSVAMDPATTTPYNNVRVICFRDRNSTGGLPIGIGGILQITSGPNAYLSSLSNAERGRWKIYYDRIFTLCESSTSMLQSDKQFIKFRKPQLVTFNNNATGPNRGNIYMLFVSDIVTGANPPLLTMNTRVRYTDGA